MWFRKNIAFALGIVRISGWNGDYGLFKVLTTKNWRIKRWDSNVSFRVNSNLIYTVKGKWNRIRKGKLSFVNKKLWNKYSTWIEHCEWWE